MRPDGTVAKPAPDMDIVMVGHFAKDRLVYQGQVEVASGGAVYYGGIALRRLGLRVAVVTRLAPADFPLLEELRAEGIQVYATSASQTSGIENTYLTPDMDRRICKLLGFAGRFEMRDIPDLRPKAWLLGPIIAGEIGLDLLRELHSRGACIALDVQGFVRVPEGDDLVFHDWADKGEGLSYVTYLKADSAEAQALTGLSDLRMAAAKLAAYGPAEVIVTHSAGVLVYARGRYAEAPFRPRQIRGRTGRGDTTFAVYVGKRLLSEDDAFAAISEACRYAAAVASLKMESPGPFRRSLAEVEELLKSY